MKTFLYILCALALLGLVVLIFLLVAIIWFDFDFQNDDCPGVDDDFFDQLLDD